MVKTQKRSDVAQWDTKLEELRRELKASPPNERAAMQCIDRLVEAAVAARGDFLDRDDAIRLFVACTMARVPILFLGPPGTAKSLIVRRMAELCGVDTSAGKSGYFEYLLNQYTMPEELFGPPDITKLTQEASVFERNTRGKLPEANFAFLDEIFRGSGHILNTLLSIINERRFHDGQGPRPVPLVALAGAANAVPGSEDLAAFVDRFPIRIWMHSVFDGFDGNRRERAETLLLHEQTLAQSDGVEPPTCLGDFVIVQEYLARNDWEVPPEFLDAFLTFRAEANLSDRSLYTLARVARALALLDSQEDDLEYLLEVFRYTSPTPSEAERLADRVDQFLRGRERTGDA